MPSNALTSRRSFLSRPLVCKPPPPPPPDAPPIGPWPTDPLNVTTTYDFTDWSGQHQSTASYALARDGENWFWSGIGFDGTTIHSIDAFTPNSVTEAVEIFFSTWPDDFSYFEQAWVLAYPLNWGVHTFYTIIAWDGTSVPFDLMEMKFIF